MFLKLLLLFSLVPLFELWLLIRVGGYFGFLPTILLVASTGVVGASLARSQGFLVISQIQGNLNSGKLPANSLIEGLLILIGGVMLLTPGLVTDIAGFSLVLPKSRAWLRELLKRKFKGLIKTGNVKFSVFGPQSSSSTYQQHQGKEGKEEWDKEESIDVDFEELDED
ncbi:FxsA family protein [Fuchsiella alkaliacetigena]|uniref:FxsA family protein n=1 Tax=Fuchsiella alkaliacetigena TaxID=957042 RepID=UPI00200A420C|nr:FxsA family protein [Fuchsiella alkaliacetigena]MCK8824775.1 FxsA family protein [Fuchsiella alkaliacetigena]